MDVNIGRDKLNFFSTLSPQISLLLDFSSFFSPRNSHLWHVLQRGRSAAVDRGLDKAHPIDMISLPFRVHLPSFRSKIVTVNSIESMLTVCLFVTLNAVLSTLNTTIDCFQMHKIVHKVYANCLKLDETPCRGGFFNTSKLYTCGARVSFVAALPVESLQSGIKEALAPVTADIPKQDELQVSSCDC